MARLEDFRMTVREVACRYCIANRGKPCRSTNGKVLSRPHVARIKAWHLFNDHKTDTK